MIDEFSTDVKHVTLIKHIYSLYTSSRVNLVYYLKDSGGNGTGRMPEDKVRMKSRVLPICAIINIEGPAWIALVGIGTRWKVRGSNHSGVDFFLTIPKVSDYRPISCTLGHVFFPWKRGAVAWRWSPTLFHRRGCVWVELHLYLLSLTACDLTGQLLYKYMSINHTNAIVRQHDSSLVLTWCPVYVQGLVQCFVTW
jgi:hypothetical protein